MSLRVFADVREPGAAVVLDPDESHYLRRVRRARDGAEVVVIDPRGGLWHAHVAGGDAHRSELQIVQALPSPPPPVPVVLLLGLPEPAAVLEALPALVELGVAAIAWVRCTRSQSGPPAAARVDRVIRAAQRQCGRPTPPTLLGEHDLPTAIALYPQHPGYFAWEARRGHPDPVPGHAGARLVVGPEGGLTPDEASTLTAAGWTPLGLGPYTLRTGTAAIVGAARLLAPTSGQRPNATLLSSIRPAGPAGDAGSR